MESTSKAQAKGFKVDVVFHGQQKGQELPPARAYLFDRMGKLLASELVGKQGVTFAVEPQAGQKVMVGPDVLGSSKKPPADLEAQLVKASAVTQDIIPQQLRDGLKVAIGNHVWGCWWQTCIVVHGTVRKLLNPGDPNPQYGTICNGTVQIFQVDLGCTLDRLASFDVLTLRDRIVQVLRGAITLEQLAANPPVFVNPNPPDPAPEKSLQFVSQAQSMRVARMRHSAAASANLNLLASSLASKAGNRASQLSASATSLTDIATVLSSLEGADLRNFMVAKNAVLYPYWCWLIPDEWFCWQELGDVSIQSDGSFSAEVCFWCPADFPDLYFEVVQNIGGFDREISDPQIACSTYYDYDGSQSVDIVVDDPTAVACLPDPGRPIPGNDLYVWPTAIGNADLRGITDLESGLTTATTGLLSGFNPWGGSLALQMIFDPNLKTSSSLRYYRWSYKFDGDLGFTEIGTPVNHRYMTVSYSPLQINLHSVNLGPHTVGSTTNLFDIPDPFPGDGWVDINDPYDRPFAYFDSTGNGLAAFTYNDTISRRSGMCTLMLEMFDGSGNLAPCSNLGGSGPFKFVLPDMGVPTQYTSVLTANNITPAGQLVFRVKVDNNDTVAQLIDVDTSVPCVTDCDCGMRHYSSGSDLVSVHYVASHPNNYLTWGLAINRGTTGTVASATGATSSPPFSLPFPSTPGVFKNTAAALLGHCTSAAFAVNLNTYAEATDGYSTQMQYNRSATMAFALITP